MTMTWEGIEEQFHNDTIGHNYRIDSLQEVWQRELAALYRLESEINNGGYLQFVCNWPREAFTYSLQGLQKIGAGRMAEIVAKAQGIIDQQFGVYHTRPIPAELLFGGRITIEPEGARTVSGVELPDEVRERLEWLSAEFMRYPDDIATLGVKYYKDKLQ